MRSDVCECDLSPLTPPPPPMVSCTSLPLLTLQKKCSNLARRGGKIRRPTERDSFGGPHKRSEDAVAEEHDPSGVPSVSGYVEVSEPTSGTSQGKGVVFFAPFWR